MHQENREVPERQALKAPPELWVFQELWDHEEKLVQRASLVQKGLRVKTVSWATEEIRVILVQRGCQVPGGLQEPRDPLV